MQQKCDSNRAGGDPSDAGHFFPIFVGIVNEVSPIVKVTEGRCFEEIVFTLEKIVVR